LGFDEYATTLKKKDIQVVAILGHVICLALILLAHVFVLDRYLWDELGPLLLFLVFALVMGGLVVYVFRYREGVPVLQNVSATVLGSLYVGVPFSFFLLVRGLAKVSPYEGVEITLSGLTVDFGARVLVMILLATWATDTGAYFAGRFLGPKIGLGKLAPAASPNKTIEGGIGGFLAAVIIALLVGYLWLLLPLLTCVIGGLIIGVAGQFGDLCKSILKRDAGVKDFGSLIPGHGGVLDRFDSLMMNVPLIYLYLWLAGLLGTGV
jgi:phosphatidate cytidylyltransferase